MTNGTGKPKQLQDFVMTAKGCDFELCSGGEDEEYLEVEIHSPTDNSEDSVEVKVSPICLRNKRKCAEPRKVKDAFTAPPKKRMCFKAKTELRVNNTDNPEPFRPWSIENHTSQSQPTKNTSKEVVPKCSTVSPKTVLLLPESEMTGHDSPHIRPYTPIEQKSLIRRSQSPEQPLPLIKKTETITTSTTTTTTRERKIKSETEIKLECDSSPSSSPCDPLNLRVPLHPHLANISTVEAETLLINSAEAFPNLNLPSHSKTDDPGTSSRKEQRNYKNMTRERRIEANARERTRVHTISAAFETLRRSVPAYSHNQKLSKLSVLKIACSYIMTLSTLVGGAAALEVNPSTSLAECVDTVSKTIQKEGKLRKKKDETD